jgi:bacterioferritin (cytochrome b1)
MSAVSPVEAEILLYSYYRDAELRGSNLLYRLLRIVDDPESQMNLTEHLADETRHAWLWTQRIKELGGTPMPVTDGYQVRIGRRAGLPRNVVDLFTLTVVVEQRALRQYTEHRKRPDTPPRTLEVLELVTKDEAWHIDWIRAKARELAQKSGEPERADRMLEFYRGVDREVMAELKAVEASWAAAE